MRRNKKSSKLLLLLIVLLTITIGYAAVSTQLKINGTATVTKQSWNVYWDEPVVTAGSKSMTAPTRTQESGDPANTKLSWTVAFDEPGEYYEFTVDAVNAGSIDAMVTGITKGVTPALPVNPAYIKYSVTYADGGEIVENSLLEKATDSTHPTKIKYRVRVYYDENEATAETVNGMSDNPSYTFTFKVTYGQATSDAVPLVLGCPGCLFSYYGNSPLRVYPTVFFNKGISTVPNPTTDYRTLVDGSNNRRLRFLGHVLDDNGKILRAYACGVKDLGLSTEKAFCVEGTAITGDDEIQQIQRDVHARNVEILTEIFGEYDSSTNPTGCEDDDGEYYCGSSSTISVTASVGTVYTTSNFGDCKVFGGSSLIVDGIDVAPLYCD